jgi:GDPmannose 4,6-dehydratase
VAKTAFISGITGQDGAYLARLLLQKGYRVVGGLRRSSVGVNTRLHELGIANDVEFAHFDLVELSNLMRSLERIKPDEIYNLAAQSFVGLSFEQPIYTADTDGLGVLRMLEAIRQCVPTARFYQASTSEMFGKVQAVPQNECTAFHPRSPYGIAKLFAHWVTVNYRESYAIHATSGLLFNHESPLRGREFVTRKITCSLAKIALGQLDAIELGNLDAQRDWGFAADYVLGMWLMLQQRQADDYVLATGQTRTIRAFAETAARRLGFDIEWRGSGVDEIGLDRRSGRTVIRVNPDHYRPTEVDLLVGDASKAKAVLGWQPSIGFEELVSLMIDEDLKRARDNSIHI